MTFKEYFNSAWADHATKTSEVAGQLEKGLGLVETNDQIPSMASLIAHVMGEHLGNWDEGVRLLNQLEKLPFFSAESESKHAILRSTASLEMSSGKRQSLHEFSTSDQVRILAISAAALSEQKQDRRAQDTFARALELAKSGLTKEDPANRALAITGNNLAVSLEQKTSRTELETVLMIGAAQAARKYWEVAGTWLEVERAEYRLAQTFLKSSDFSQAFTHAHECLRVVKSNEAKPLEWFFAYEVLALVEKARGNQAGFNAAVDSARDQFNKLSDQEKPWCEASLKNLTL